MNGGRGAILDYEVVKYSLESGHLGGLGTNVAWFEPFDLANPIPQHPKVMMTPNIVGVTQFSYKNMAKVLSPFLSHLNTHPRMHAHKHTLSHFMNMKNCKIIFWFRVRMEEGA